MMLFNLKQIKEAVDFTVGDDGLRGDEVVNFLIAEYRVTEYLSRPVNRAIEIERRNNNNG